MYSKDLKIRAIDLYEKFKSYRYVAELLNIGKSTIHRWVNDITHSNKINKYNINELVQFIKESIDENKFITINQIKNKLNKKFNIQFSPSFIYTIIIKKLQYSYKKINKKLFNGSYEKLREKQEIFIEEVKNIDKNKIICIDETYLRSNHITNYGWAPKSDRLVHYNLSNPIKYSIITAITNKRIIRCEIHKCNINSVIYKDFIKNLISKYNNHYFLMDNVVFHKTKDINELFEKSNNKQLFIPPYSPEFNPIEQVFSQIKNNLKKFNDKNIIKRISKSFKLVSRENLHNYYKNAFT